ncbi:hypothetical protein ABW19_dt0203933 [Dactylella cylindrospora]|nr:hypothetical protein ABW19_dt0203933 [Dactylella cylindrospora]
MGSIKTPPMGWPKQYTLKTNDPLAQDCVTIVCFSISGRLDVNILEQKHKEMVANWPVLGGELLTSTTPYQMSTGKTVDFKHRTINSKLKDVVPMDHELSTEEVEGTEPLVRPYRTGEGILSVPELAFDTVSTLNLKVGTLFALRATILEDATILAFKFSHFFLDGEGYYQVIRQYNNLLRGKQMPKGVPPPCIETPMSRLISGVDTIATSDLDSGGREFTKNCWQIGLGTFVRAIGRYMWDEIAPMFGLGTRGVEKHVYLPQKMISELQIACQNEVDQLSSGEDRVLISKNDVVSAWCLKRIFYSLPDARQVDMGYAFNYSDRIQREDSSGIYFQGHYYAINIPISSNAELKKASLAQVAARIRRAVIIAKQPSVIRENLKYVESVQTEKIIPVPPGGDREGYTLMSSWTKFPFEKFDWQPALVDKSGTGKVLFTNSRIILPMNIFVKPKILTFGDARGGIWVQMMGLPEHWAGFDDIKGN